MACEVDALIAAGGGSAYAGLKPTMVTAPIAFTASSCRQACMVSMDDHDGSGTCRVETGDLTGCTGTLSVEATATVALAFARMRPALAARAATPRARAGDFPEVPARAPCCMRTGRSYVGIIPRANPRPATPGPPNRRVLRTHILLARAAMQALAERAVWRYSLSYCQLQRSDTHAHINAAWCKNQSKFGFARHTRMLTVTLTKALPWFMISALAACCHPCGGP